MDTLLAICLGIGLSAAVGFRIFLPPFVVGLAAALGFIELPASAQWLSSNTALMAFGAAMLIELLAYMIPWVDNLLDTIATPLAVVAGTVLAASFLGEMPTALRWTLALVAGGGASATTQGLTTVTRAASTATTGGVANPLVSGAEAVAALLTTILALIVPVAVAAIVLAVAVFVFWRIGRRRSRSVTA